ncbi:MAG: 1-acyl-sn-glycerol-3-phosphate acyltransferase [Pirellulales bacterium]
MDRYPYAKPPRWWSPRPRRLWVNIWRPVRRRQQRRDQRVKSTDVEGLDHVRQAMRADYGVLITPNHASHADCYLLLDALLKLRGSQYIMTAWQVFHMMAKWEQLAYRHHGCFSVDREGKDLRAFRLAVKTLAATSDPLVVFPEGEVYHLNDRTTPFRDGTLMMASAAIKRGNRPIACIPCALKYFYVKDPSPELRCTTARIEANLGVKSVGKLPLAVRVERLQTETLAWRERQFLGGCREGNPAQRRDTLVDTILVRYEHQFGIHNAARNVPERVKQLRQHLVESGALAVSNTRADENASAAMEDIFVAVQLYSYAFGYVSESPTIERVAETVDKLEEDVLGAPTATVRGTRRGVVRFGNPLILNQTFDRSECQEIGEDQRARLQSLLDGFQSREKVPA